MSKDKQTSRFDVTPEGRVIVSNEPHSRLSSILSYLTEALEAHPWYHEDDRVVLLAVAADQNDRGAMDAGTVLQGYVSGDGETYTETERMEGTVEAIADMVAAAEALALSVGLRLELQPKFTKADAEAMARVQLTQRQRIERQAPAPRPPRTPPRPFISRGGDENGSQE